MADEEKPASKPEDIVSEARQRFERAKDFYGPSRVLAIEDTRFAMGDSDNGWQWPDAIRQGRVVDQRVCLTVNMTAQHCNQIINNTRQNRPQCRVLPVDSGADKKTAEILAGLIRNIQTSSTDDAPDLAAEHAVYGGEGYWRLVTEYESPSSFKQIIKRKPCPNPQLVFIDDTCQELDKSDAEWGFVFEDISKEQCKREYPTIECSDWAETPSGWVNKDTVRVAEYFYCTYKDDTAILLSDGSEALASELAAKGIDIKTPGLVLDQRPTKIKQWKWCKLVGGHDEPVDERDWKGKYLPIIAVVGKELNVNGQVVRKGIVRDLKDPARMVNYSYSETIQTVALQNKIPYIAAAESTEGYEDEWKNANSSNASYLPYNAYDDDGNQLPKPERQQPAVVPAAQVQLLQVSTEQMRAASGQQNANFGIKSEAASGVGIQRLKVQGETATFHFPDNLRRALQYEAKVTIDLIQNYYDTKRVVRILGLDGKEEKATLDPNAEQPYQEVGTTEQDIERIFNPLVGQYDVVIDTGPSFQTQRQEGFTMLSDIASRNPQLMQVAGDLIMRSADIPGAQEIADRLEKTLPPGIADKKGNQQAQMAQQLQELSQKDQQHQQVIGAMQEHIDKLESDIKGKVIENQTRLQVAQMQQRTTAAQGVADHAVKTFDAETKRMAALVPSMGPAALKPLIMEVLNEIMNGPPLEAQAPQTDQAPSGAFSLGDPQGIVASPTPAMDATGAQPGLGQEPNLSEGTPNV
jgi:hypothetical protein